MKCIPSGSYIRGIDKDLARGIEDACFKPESSISPGSHHGCSIAFA